MIKSVLLDLPSIFEIYVVLCHSTCDNIVMNSSLMHTTLNNQFLCGSHNSRAINRKHTIYLLEIIVTIKIVNSSCLCTKLHKVDFF